MTIRRITLSNDSEVGTTTVSDYGDIHNALNELGIPHPKPVIVLVGGAGGIEEQHMPAVQKAINISAQLAEEIGAVVIDGGTQFGVMLEIGKQRKYKNFSFTLLGILPNGKFAQKNPKSILEPNHSHFIFVPGDNWGDESIWIAKIATILSGHEKSITILINGGKISKMDVECSLAENCPTIIMRGTGRLADEISLTDGAIEADISKTPQELFAYLRSMLL